MDENNNVVVRVPEQQFVRGEDGYSPVVTIEEIEHGHSVNITDREHQEEGQTFNVLDGDSAYEQAVAGGYTGTEAQFNEDLANFKTLHDETEDAAPFYAVYGITTASEISSALNRKGQVFLRTLDERSIAPFITEFRWSRPGAAGRGFRFAKIEGTVQHVYELTDAWTSYTNDLSAPADRAEEAAAQALNRMNSADASAQSAAGSASNASRDAGTASAAATTATEKAGEASDSATAADGSAKDSEAYAIGKRGGTDVGSTDPAYHNNSKYYAEQAASSASDAVTAKGAAETAQGKAEDAQEAAEQAQEAAEAVLESIPSDYTELSEDVDDLKSAVSAETRNLVFDKISNANFNTNGSIKIDGVYDIWVAPVVNGENYAITTDEPPYQIYAFFTDIPSVGSTAYENQRYVTNTSYVTAPVTGYIAVRSSIDFDGVQVERGTQATPYIPHITATDFVAREELANTIEELANTIEELANTNEELQEIEAEVDDLKSAITENTYNIVEGIILNSNITSTGNIQPNMATATYCVAYAQVEQGKSYNCISNDTGFVYSFFSEKPSYETTAYDGRHVESSNVFIAPIDGYVALRIIGQDAPVQIAEGEGDKLYVPLVTACDYITRNFNPLYKKYLVATGDSLTAGAGIQTPGGDNDRQTKATYAYLTAQRNEMNYYNDALSGSTMTDIIANGQSKRGFSKTRYLNIPSNADFLTILFGWNDHAYGPLSYKDIWCQTNYDKLYKDCTTEEKAACDSAEDWDNIWLGEVGSVDVKTWSGAWNTVLDYYMRNRSNTKIGIILPYFITPYDALALSMRERLITISKSFGVSYIDGADCCVWASTGYSIGISASASTYLKSQRTLDGLHDNAFAYKLKASQYEQWLKRL